MTRKTRSSLSTINIIWCCCSFICYLFVARNDDIALPVRANSAIIAKDCCSRRIRTTGLFCKRIVTHGVSTRAGAAADILEITAATLPFQL